ncbi:MAG: hypothetical protein RM338_02125 [Nostoc sp. DedQUE12a]|nr:hypothetical protein [Nostoc sp. DedQUE12a]
MLKAILTATATRVTNVVVLLSTLTASKLCSQLSYDFQRVGVPAQLTNMALNCLKNISKEKAIAQFQ